MKQHTTKKWTGCIILILFLILIAGFFLSFRAKNIIISGCDHYTQEEMKDMLFESLFDNNTILFYMKYRYIGLKDIPFVQKITVKREGRNGLKIKVYEKTLVASIKYMGEYVYFDKEGTVLESSQEPVGGIPNIVGLHSKGFVLYESLQVKEKDIFAQILDLSQLLQRYNLEINKIRFNDQKEVELECNGIRIYLGKKDFYDEQIAALSEILPKAVDQKLKGVIHMENYTSGSEVILKCIE
ncbi:cell division protein FtsQ/DivIB [Velocimicrobium porci]|uniref:Cell division protein FtsQ/DivIB C-terminal domain-containing protein n=1 Tax=Velocimicrobium porci TaxID=2606634 RepID=A0A6L5XX49_9FIRM|nr:cell division protein FtsQ/DivIB [Velocimicrobium porci]MSS63031.1 hypothetical protein [Velocimicrobium porci]